MKTDLKRSAEFVAVSDVCCCGVILPPYVDFYGSIQTNRYIKFHLHPMT